MKAWRSLLFCTLLGLFLRLLNLGGKPLWADEWTTVVFSLGHSFRDLPLNQLLTREELLRPLRLDEATALDGVRYLMNESTHPPLYFWLSHYWIQMWQQPGQVVSSWVGRSLSALFGTLTIPATYLLGHGCGATERTKRFATALMAVSPFGIYLAQEARHYTLAMLWSMVSLACFVRAWRSLPMLSPISPTASTPPSPLSNPAPIPWHTVLGWTGINALGFATHYVFALFLAAQGLAMGGRWCYQLLCQLKRSKPSFLLSDAWQRVAIAALGSALGMLPWVGFLGRASDSDLTTWIESDLSGWALLSPLGRLFTWLLSMTMALPVEQVPGGVAIASVLVLLGMLIWLVPSLIRGGIRVLIRGGWCCAQGVVLFQPLLVLFSAQLIVVLVLTYAFQRDLTLSSRYLFTLLPQVVLGVAIALNAAGLRLASPSCKASRQQAIALLLVGCLGSVSVAFGWVYQKPDRPDLLVTQVQNYYQTWQTTAADVWPGDPLAQDQPRSLVMAIIQKTHSETGKLFGVAQEWHKRSGSGLQTPSFVLLRRNPDTYAATRGIRDATATVARPFDLWLINFSASGNFRDLGCTPEADAVKLRSPGYSARRFVCN